MTGREIHDTRKLELPSRARQLARRILHRARSFEHSCRYVDRALQFHHQVSMARIELDDLREPHLSVHRWRCGRHSAFERAMEESAADHLTSRFACTIVLADPLGLD